MLAILQLLGTFVVSLFQLEVQNLFLRHQLNLQGLCRPANYAERFWDDASTSSTELSWYPILTCRGYLSVAAPPETGFRPSNPSLTRACARGLAEKDQTLWFSYGAPQPH